MSNSKSPFWQAFDKWERTVGEPLEELVASKSYTEVIVTLEKVRGAIRGAVAGVASEAVENVLHVVQIPTRSDVRRLNRQIVELATEVRTLSARLQEDEVDPPPAKAPAKRRKASSAATKRPSRKRTAGSDSASTRAKRPKQAPRKGRKVADGD